MDYNSIEIFLIAVTGLGAVVVGIIGYFLKQEMAEIKQIKTDVTENKIKLQVIENDYLNKIERLNEKFDDLQVSIDKLSSSIEKLVDGWSKH